MPNVGQVQLPGVKSIRLDHYRSFRKEEIDKYKSSVKYAIVFDADDP